MLKRSLPFYLFFTLLLFSTETFSQAFCGFDDLHRQKMRTDPGYRLFIDNFEKRLRQKTSTSSRDNSNVIDTIPVVVHIIHTGDTIGSIFNPSDERIEAAINYTNQVYAGTYPGIGGAGDIRIRFVLAKRDPNCNPTNGIDRTDGSVLPLYAENGISFDGSPGASVNQMMDLVKWDPYRYYNIWVINSFNLKNKGSIAAFAFFPYDASQDGTVIMAQYIREGNSSLTHELGHAFFLYHVFQGSSGAACPANNDCTTDGDNVCDTDPVTEPASEDRTGINPCTNVPYNEYTEKNFMNYVCCKTLFTQGQKVRMKQTIINNPLRDTLTRSMGRFAPDEATVCSFTLHLDGTLTQNDIFLQWKQGGLNGKDYYIERSYDGTQFTSIGVIPFNSSVSGYSFHDADIAQEKNYYRLKQTIFNEEVNYSNTVVINNPVIKQGPLTVLNNPAHNYIDLQFGLLKNVPCKTLPVYHGTVEIRLTDMSGRTISRYTQPVNAFQRFRIPAYNIPPGIYILQVWLNKNLFTNKIVKI